jgi:hypothetical protein
LTQQIQKVTHLRLHWHLHFHLVVIIIVKDPTRLPQGVVIGCTWSSRVWSGTSSVIIIWRAQRIIFVGRATGRAHVRWAVIAQIWTTGTIAESIGFIARPGTWGYEHGLLRWSLIIFEIRMRVIIPVIQCRKRRRIPHRIGDRRCSKLACASSSGKNAGVWFHLLHLLQQPSGWDVSGNCYHLPLQIAGDF